MHTRFRKWTGQHSGGTHEAMDCDKYILEKLQFLELQQSCTILIAICVEIVNSLLCRNS